MPTTPRRKRSRARLDETHELEMTPMIDVTFLLLIFFLCTLRFKTLEGKLAAYLPKGEGVNVGEVEDPVEIPEVEIVVADAGTKRARGGGAWDGFGAFEYGPDRRVAYRVSGGLVYDSLDRLEAWLGRQFAVAPENRVSLEVADGVRYAEVVEALDSISRAGWTEVSFRGVER